MKIDKMKIVMWVVLIAGWEAVVSITLARSAGVFDQLDLLIDVRHEIVSGYVEEADQQKMIEAAVHGMVDTLNDPYTIYLPPEQVEVFDDQVLGRFSGIGAEVTIDEQIKRLKIVTPLEDSPAWRSGVMAGDLVLEIDGESTEELRNIFEAVKKLKGPEGSQVRVRVRHESGEEEDITITRALINVKSVRGFRRDENNKWIYMLDPQQKIGYVKIRQFTDRTADELREALDPLSQAEVRGLILDVRFNPGGLLSAAVAVSDIFLDGGKKIVSVRGRAVAEKTEHSKSEGTFSPIPLVIMANEASASAAEIVTGALTDNNRACFIGMRTYGKGSVQQLRMLNGAPGAMKITTAFYYLPEGRLIHRREDSEVWGVDPQDGFFVPMPPKEIREMRRARAQTDVLQKLNDEAITPEWIEQNLVDRQLAAALAAMVGKLDTGAWPTVGKSGAKILARESRRAELRRRLDLIRETLANVEKELAELDEDGQDEDANEDDAPSGGDSGGEGRVIPPQASDDGPDPEPGARPTEAAESGPEDTPPSSP